jgi:endoglucanase
MKTLQQTALFVSLLVLAASISNAASSPIRLNSIGYLPMQEKQATIVPPCKTFVVIKNQDKSVVYESNTSQPFENQDTKETVCIADFSTVTQPGEYHLVLPETEQSMPFQIHTNVYVEPYKTVMKGMYLWRCGTAVSAVHNGITFAHEACHMDDAYLDYVGQKGVKKDGRKGWHDAGDYNKYIVNAGVTVGAMFMAWEQCPAIRSLALSLPPSETNNNLPDFLDEMKWEMDWVLTMQMDNGAVYHKLTTEKFGPFILPEKETAKRYFTPWSSAATADFAAMTAMAARIFEPYDSAYAKQCLDAAKKSYAFLKAHPEDHRADLDGFSTGAYQTRDSDDRLWAAAEMWQTTGDKAYLTDFESQATTARNLIDTNWDWSNVNNLGMFTYLLSERKGKNAELENKIRTALIENADALVKTSDAHGYGRPLGTRYYWGCNGTVARQCMNLMVAHQLSPNQDYVETSLAALSYLFGRNYYNRSFVTGLGIDPPMRPHSRRSGGDEINDPWPGYLVGGGHSGTDWVDVEESYSHNEIAINWNGALVYALSAFVEAE